jgi:hypothetical protein
VVPRACQSLPLAAGGGEVQGQDHLTGGGATSRPFAAKETHGDAYAMIGSAKGRDDQVTGGGIDPSASNCLHGDAHVMSGQAQAGNDTLLGGTYAENEMWGDAAVIEGDCVTTGCDVFVITPESGTNRIHDFEQGKDLIDLTAFKEIRGFDELLGFLALGSEPGTTFYFGSTGGDGPNPLIENSVTVLAPVGLTPCDVLFA